MEKFRKYIALALMLAFAVTMVGCGDSGNNEEQETVETGAEATEIDDSEMIGAGVDVNTELDMETEKPHYFISDDIMILHYGDSILSIVPTIMNRSEESVEASWQGFLLDGAAVDWHVEEHIPPDTYDPDTVSFPLEPNSGRSLGVVLDADIFEHSELTVQALIRFNDGREPLPVSAIFQISELEQPEETVESTTDSDDALAAGMAAYREIVTHADTYDYTYEEAYLDPGSRNGVYHYALVFAGSDDVPALLLKQDGDTGFNIVKVFQYASGWGDVYEAGILAEGVDNLGFHRSLYIPTDKPSIIYNESYGDNKGGETRRYTITGAGSSESNLHLGLQYGLLWSSINSGSNVDTSLEETGRVEIEWYDITDMTGLDNGRPSGE